ncbi:GNAT family N-acetyltransferase [Lysinibacillus sp. FSL M8-0216]|uniref:Acetyltransferase (GNAT) family protein n=1 Tax=Lysinibacillus fusiformis TaxID=28031 RepID=A0A1H9B8T3_9BACI|nr:GNAT family N-acetyltransferase [Lysinibacillus fusiformis]MCG7434914.1 GNAT family N-acetyltransferase [Lysinibacillus fusiformis]SCX41800.1 Acetyltransferase (GNAT) family protein [Lysinibacillus fusiformis]SCX80364.1 Acetyltransferase (GNAT) family protein [Lysinibacillus fusiformis]SDB11125.1 Acetyltransferase (GNAT) family protein [Lysinibacillus fusiformis]SEM74291.1 Acetyltransferase (GNAT) family protein [Lysinibacillus fusiformis]
MTHIEIVEMDGQLLEGIGSYCLRSKKIGEGYKSKNKWLNQQFEKGLRYIQLLEEQKQVGFIEYTDAEYSSRVVHAEGYIMIHCLWVSAVGKGYGTQLLQKCIDDAKQRGKKGVAVLTNDHTSWTPSKALFLQHQFQLVATAPFDFELLVYPFSGDVELPYFPENWHERLAGYHNLTILRSFQCPYVEVATENILAAASKLDISVDLVEIQSREELMEKSPTPYGIFSVIYKGQLISFHRLTVHSIYKKLQTLLEEPV